MILYSSYFQRSVLRTKQNRHMPVIPEWRKMRQEDDKFEVSQGWSGWGGWVWWWWQWRKMKRRKENNKDKD